MSCADVIQSALEPALKLLPPNMDTPEARVLTLAIGLQESELKCRVQKGGGPARGLWQFEHGGGVVGVCTHPGSKHLMQQLCEARGVEFDSRAIYQQLAHDDVLAAGAARLLLWTDPRPLPPLGMDLSAWHYYLRNWRPGKPRPEHWPDNYLTAWRA